MAIGTSESRTVLVVNSKALLSVPVESVRTPSRVEVATMVATSSKLKAESASVFGSTPNSRTAPLAITFNTTITGRKSVATATRGVASRSTARSGTENEMFLGTISPNTTWRNDTTRSVMTKAIVPITSSFHPVRCSGPSRR